MPDHVPSLCYHSSRARADCQRFVSLHPESRRDRMVSPYTMTRGSRVSATGPRCCTRRGASPRPAPSTRKHRLLAGRLEHTNANALRKDAHGVSPTLCAARSQATHLGIEGTRLGVRRIDGSKPSQYHAAHPVRRQSRCPRQRPWPRGATVLPRRRSALWRHA